MSLLRLKSSSLPGVVKDVEQDVPYRAYLWNPTNGDETDLGGVMPDENGDWALPLGTGPSRRWPIFQDWIVVLERRGSG